MCFQRLFFYFSQIIIVYLFIKFYYKPFLSPFFFGYDFYFFKSGYLIYFIYYLCWFRRNYLPSITPVYFISIIFRRIMTCSNYYSCKTAFISYTERQFRCRPQIRMNIRFYSICCHYSCRVQCIFPWTYSGIVSNYYSFFFSFFFATFKHIISKSLCCFSYHILINSVCSYPSYPSHSSCSKTQIFKKSVFNFFLITL